MENIPDEMNAQIKARMDLISSMQESGIMLTDIKFLETPLLLIMHMKDDALKEDLKKLKKTRRKGIIYGFNGRMFAISRKTAIELTKQEIGLRAKG